MLYPVGPMKGWVVIEGEGFPCYIHQLLGTHNTPIDKNTDKPMRAANEKLIHFYTCLSSTIF